MKSLLSWFLALGVLGGAGAYGLDHYNTLNRTHAYEQKLATLQAEYQTRSAGLVHLSSEEYAKEIGIHLTRYFRELNKLAKTYPEIYDVERERRHSDAEVAAGRMTEMKKSAREERIALTLDLLNKMRSGQFRPLYTGVDKGFRFDIWDIRPVRIGSDVTLQISYAHWGAYGPVSYDRIVGNIRTPRQAGAPVEVPQIVGEGQAPYLQVNPGRWVQEFVPGLEIGHYTFPMLPPTAEGLQLNFEFTLRTVGGSNLAAEIKFPEMNVPEAWKVGKGAKWKTRERFASDEELEELGVNPNEK